MQFFRETHIDFLGKRRLAGGLSVLLILAGIVSLVINGGPRLGIDFAGGSQIVVRFATMPDIGSLRDTLAAEGLEEDSQIQEFEPGSHEVLIRTPRLEQADEAEVEALIDQALERIDPPPAGAAGKFDLNTVGATELAARLLELNPLELDVVVQVEESQSRYREIAESILAPREQQGMFASWDELEAVVVDARVMSAVRDNAYLGNHRVLNVEWVGPQVGRDLQRQALQAITWALMGLLAYISYRFEFRYGVAAVVALVHDVLIAVGAFSITGREFNLPVIAAFLTIVGYSLNDTVVVFDRIRENNQVMRREPLQERINTSVNQTLGRTVLTSGTTLLVVASLYLYGGPVINDFSFALLVGVIVGTYSSIFVASPVIYVWNQWTAKRARK